MKTMLYFIELDNLENFIDYEQYIKLLSPEKQVQIHKFRFDIDKKLSLLSDLFIRFFTCKALNLNNDDLSFQKNDYGKPYLIGFSDFQYNISHTRNAIVIGVSDKPIGVDIEKVGTANLKIAELFFCDSELEYILSCEERNKAFYEIWTRKEAYMKWTGKGLSLPLSSFDVTDYKLIKMLSNLEVGDYILAICSETDFRKSDLKKYNEDQVEKILSKLALDLQ